MVKNCKTHLKPISLLLLAILLVRINAQTGTCTACASNCNACTSPTVCTTAASGYYLSSGAPSACATGCSVCTSSTVCTTAASGYYLNAGAPVACATGCSACTSSACTTAATGYYLTSVAAATPAACATGCSACTSSACTTAATGYYLTSVAAATPAACATGCSACTSPTVCTTAASGYYLSSSAPVACTTGCSTCTASTASGCSTCSSGYYITLSYGAAPVSSSNSGSFSSSVLNTTAVKVLSGSNSTDSAKWDSSSTTTTVAGVLASYTYFGPGLVNTTSYLYGIPTSGVSSATSAGYISTSTSYTSGQNTATIYTVSTIRKRTINATTVGTGSDSTEASVTGDTTISTSFLGLPGAYAVAPGYLALLSTSYDSATAATGSVNAQVYITLVSGSAGTAATTKLTSTSDVWASSSSAPAANTACVTTTYGLGNIWYDIGASAFFFTYWKKTITSAATNSLGSCSTTTTTAYTIYLGGIYLSGSLYWTPPISVSAYTSTAPVTSLIGGSDNWLNSSNIYIAYKDTTTGTVTTYYSKTTKSNSTTAIATFSALIKDTSTGTSGTSGYVASTFYPVSVWASNYTNAITVANVTSTYTTSAATTYTYTNFLNSTTSTAISTTGVDSGLSNSAANSYGLYFGYQLNTGYSVIAYWPTGTTTPYSNSYTLGTYYANGTVNKTAATLGSTTYTTPQFYEDLNGTYWIGWIDVDTANTVSGYGYLTYNAYLGILQGQLNSPSSNANLLSALSAIVLLFAAIFIF